MEQNKYVYVWNSDETLQKPTKIELDYTNEPITYKGLRQQIQKILDIDEKQINIIDPSKPDIKELYDWSVQTETEIQNLELIKVIITHKKPNPIVIGLTGPTRCGKGTLCGYLKHSLNAEIMNLDEFYKSEDYINNKLGGNWEIPESYDWDNIFQAIGAKIEECKQKDKQYLVIDSFMLFYKPHLYNICDFRFFIEIPQEIVQQRRGNYVESYEGYFEKTLVPEMDKYRNFVNTNYPKESINFISGMQKKLEIFQQVKKIIIKK